MADLLRLVRFKNLLIAAAGVLAGGWIALGAVAISAPLAWAALSAIGIGMAGNVMNDIWDQTADAKNRRTDRPLVGGAVSRGSADLCVLWGVLLGLGAAALVDGAMVALAAAALVVMAAYSPLLKRWGLPGNLAVAGLAGFPLAYGAWAVGHLAAGVVPWVLGAWLHFGREILKDLTDVSGDQVMGRRTIPIVWGRERAGTLARIALWSFVPASFVLPGLSGYGVWYFAVAALAGVGIVRAILTFERGSDGPTRAIGILKASMVAGIAGLILGRVA